ASSGRNSDKQCGCARIQPTSAPAFFQAVTISFGRGLGGSFLPGTGPGGQMRLGYTVPPAPPLRTQVASMASAAIPSTDPFHVERFGCMRDLVEMVLGTICIFPTAAEKSSQTAWGVFPTARTGLLEAPSRKRPRPLNREERPTRATICVTNRRRWVTVSRWLGETIREVSAPPVFRSALERNHRMKHLAIRCSLALVTAAAL